jgi:ABC-type uncharacterized transport system substrate-binding protein
MKRRDFIALVGGMFAAWTPLKARAQQRVGPPRLDVVLAVGKTTEYAAAVAAFEQQLASLGWKAGENIRIEYHWSAGTQEIAQSVAKEIEALRPDVILAQSQTVVDALMATGGPTPIVFEHIADPVASGIVSSLSHPGGNVTGITNTEPSIGGKWLQLLKEIAPAITRAAVLINRDTSADRAAIFLNPFEAAIRSLGMTSLKGDVRDVAGIEAVMEGLATPPGGGIVVTPEALFASHSAEIVNLAARFQVPAIYPYRYYVTQGGLVCYGVNNVDLFRQAAPYIDRILRGTKPADLPVQQPTRFELVINRRTANGLGLNVPQSLLVSANEVIE